MGLQRYPLSPAIWGAGEEIRLTHVVQAALFTDFAADRSTSYIDVDLEANPLTGSWRVRYNGAVIGTVPAPDRARFPDVERVHQSLLRPGTTAELRFNADSGHFDVAVILPPTQLAVPRNDTPAGAWVLPPGDMLVIDTAAGEFSAEELAMLSPGQWFVALHRIGGTVVALYDGRVLGSFNGTDATDIATAVDDTLAMGAPEVYARAVLLDGMAGLDVGHPDEGVVLVPALSVPDTRPRRPWSVVDFPDGSWGITVEHDYVTDAEDELRPLHTARYVSLAGGPRPEDMAAPTEMFGVVDDAGSEATFDASAPDTTAQPASEALDDASNDASGEASFEASVGTVGDGELGPTAPTPAPPGGSTRVAVNETGSQETEDPEVAGAPLDDPRHADPSGPPAAFTDLHSAHLAGFSPQREVQGAGDYLTEVEKVRLRREQRATEATGLAAQGRHRAPERTLQQFIEERNATENS